MLADYHLKSCISMTKVVLTLTGRNLPEDYSGSADIK